MPQSNNLLPLKALHWRVLSFGYVRLAAGTIQLRDLGEEILAGYSITYILSNCQLQMQSRT